MECNPHTYAHHRGSFAIQSSFNEVCQVIFGPSFQLQDTAVGMETPYWIVVVIKQFLYCPGGRLLRA